MAERIVRTQKEGNLAWLDLEMTGLDAQHDAILQAAVAARIPFIDFIFSRVNADGSQQTFRVSGEPMFNRSCGFIGYRGIGVETTSK